MRAHRQMRASAQSPGLRVVHPAGTEQDGHLRDKVAAHVDGGAARLAEARVPVMQRETKRRADAFAAERRRAAPYTRPGQDLCEHVSAGQSHTGTRTPEPRTQVRILPGG